MSLYKTHPEAGLMHVEAEEMERKLKFGDGIMWAGDPRLELRMAVLKSPKYHQSPLNGRWYNKGEIMARRYEVWRHNEDGSETRIGSWRLHEFDRILMDLAPMRLESPNHEDTLDAIDKHNAEIEAKHETQIRDNLQEATMHLAEAVRNESGPGVTFAQMPGLRDEAPSKTGANAAPAESGK